MRGSGYEREIYARAVDKRITTGHGAISIETEDARQICYVRDEDNARLIAAAPELLEALRLMVNDDFSGLPLGEQARTP